MDLYEYIRKKDVGGGDLSVSERCDIIWKDLTTASKEDVAKIQQATTEQSESSLWQKARSYRITASKCHDVMTCRITLQKDQSQTPENLIKGMLYSKEVTTPAMVIRKTWKRKPLRNTRLQLERII